jgi:PQQ-like domain
MRARLSRFCYSVRAMTTAHCLRASALAAMLAMLTACTRPAPLAQGEAALPADALGLVGFYPRDGGVDLIYYTGRVEPGSAATVRYSGIVSIDGTTGGERWRRLLELRGCLHDRTDAISGDVAYLHAGDATAAVNPADGALLWRAPNDVPGSEPDCVYGPAFRGWAGHAQVVRRQDFPIGGQGSALLWAQDARSGATLWHGQPDLPGVARVLPFADRLLVEVSQYSGSARPATVTESTVLVLDPATGAMLQRLLLACASDEPGRNRAYFLDGARLTVFAARQLAPGASSDVTMGQCIERFDLTTGQRLWQSDASADGLGARGASLSASIVAAPGAFLVAAASGDIWHIDAQNGRADKTAMSGWPLTQTDAATLLLAGGADASDALLPAGDAAAISAACKASPSRAFVLRNVDRATGVARWRTEIPTAFACERWALALRAGDAERYLDLSFEHRLTAHGLVLLLSDAQEQCVAHWVDPKDGRLLRSKPLGVMCQIGARTRLNWRTDVLWLHSGQSALAIDLATGERRLHLHP